jgi:hypothetical protein
VDAVVHGHLHIARVRTVELQLQVRIAQCLLIDTAILIIEFAGMRRLLPNLAEQQRR